MSTDIYLKIRDHKYQKKTLYLLDEIKNIIDSYDVPWTVRQLHYNLVEKRIIQNTQNDYKKISRTSTDGRYSGHLPWNKIVDDTRGAYKTTSYDSIENGISSFLKRFRLEGRWADSNNRIEVWVEKRALRRLFYPITDKYDVYLAIGGGWNSTSAIWDAVERILMYNTDRLDILYFGDLDPSGDDMPRDVEKRLREFRFLTTTVEGEKISFPSEIYVSKILINEEELEKYHLPKRFDVPAKKGNNVYNKIKADPRARGFYKKYRELFQVEIEALSPKILVDTLEEHLLKYVDIKKMEQVQKLEKQDINRINQLIQEDGEF